MKTLQIGTELRYDILQQTEPNGTRLSKKCQTPMSVEPKPYNDGNL